MGKELWKMPFFLLLLLLCAGCSTNNEKLPGINIPVQEMNRSIKLIPNPGGGNNIPKNNEPYSFQLKNLSDQVIVFPGDYGIKLFIKKGENWIGIVNRMNFPDGEIILPLAKKFPPGRIVSIIPSILELNQTISVRVVIVGHLENNPSEIVAGYSDILLNP